MASQPERELTQEELDDYREAFNNFDLDRSGAIEQHELATVMRSLGYAPTDKQLRDMMAKVDLNGDGSIEFKEFVFMMRKCEVETDFEKEIKAAFKFFDKNQDGEISHSELSEIMRGLGANLNDEEIDMLVREADLDGDGVISLKEFMQVMYG